MRLRRPRVDTRDVLAGVSVAVVLVPQSLAYAQLAGMPAYRGLFAAAIPPLVAAPFASSPYLQPGPTAVSALLTYGALSPLAPLGSTLFKLTFGGVVSLLTLKVARSNVATFWPMVQPSWIENRKWMPP